MTTAKTITDSQIRTLRDKAADAGDEALVNLCNAALGLAEAWMVDEAREQCAKAIAAAEAADVDATKTKLTTDHLWFHWLTSSDEAVKRLCLAAQNGDEAARAAVAAMPADRSRLLSVAEAEGRRIGWPGPRGAAFPVDGTGQLFDDRCLNHERIDPASCPICRGTHWRPVVVTFGS